MRFLFFLLSTVALLLPATHADLYLNFERGSNNRLNEQNRDRDNGNRLFDSQNNNRGGYNVGSSGKRYYYDGTTIPLQWTVQHACNQPHMNCEMVLQYTCDDKMRDGTTTQTIPEYKDDRCDGEDCDDDVQFGRHESILDYKYCKWRTRNKGLFTADRNLRGNSARFTLQNENGDRRGLECPEERDYYPYWQPSIWRDIAIMTDRPERCPNYRRESQNVKARGYCSPRDLTKWYDEGSVPIDETACTNDAKGLGLDWKTAPAFEIPAPDCLSTIPSRDNHHGNTVDGWMVGYNWTVPKEAIGENCVIRLRYNMSSGDFPYGGFGGSSGDDWTSVQGGILNAGDNRNPKNKDSPSEYAVWLKYNLTREDVIDSFGQKAAPTTFGGGKRGYVWEQNPVVDIFGSLFTQIPDPQNAGQTIPPVRLRLAINTNQYFRTFEDRTHIMAFRKRPQQLEGLKIHNLGVRGKRGNIVQVYPGVEYDFVPNKLDIVQGELIHIQWIGADTNPKNNDGTAHTPAGADRHNVILLGNRTYYELGIEGKDVTDRGVYGRAYPGRVDPEDRYAFLGLDHEDIIKLAFYGINASYFDLGPRQVTRTGTYYYVATTNNNFSNRDQKARIVVTAASSNTKAIEWGKDSTMLNTGGAWISKSEWTTDGDFTPSTTQEMYLEQLSSGKDYASDWIHVHPDGPLAVPKGQTLMLTLKQRQAPLQDGVLYWAATPEDSKLQEMYEVQPTSGDLSVSINQGGYYVVKHRLNSAVLGGVLIAVIFFVFVTTYLYYKIRIQPVGWSFWWNGLRGPGKKGKDDNIALQDKQDKQEKKMLTPRTVPSSSMITTNAVLGSANTTTSTAAASTDQFAQPKVQQFTAQYQSGPNQV